MMGSLVGTQEWGANSPQALKIEGFSFLYAAKTMDVIAAKALPNLFY